jgi:hypothetical protein
MAVETKTLELGEQAAQVGVVKVQVAVAVVQVQLVRVLQEVAQQDRVVVAVVVGALALLGRHLVVRQEVMQVMVALA